MDPVTNPTCDREGNIEQDKQPENTEFEVCSLAHMNELKKRTRKTDEEEYVPLDEEEEDEEEEEAVLTTDDDRMVCDDATDKSKVAKRQRAICQLLVDNQKKPPFRTRMSEELRAAVIESMQDFVDASNEELSEPRDISQVLMTNGVVEADRAAETGDAAESIETGAGFSVSTKKETIKEYQHACAELEIDPLQPRLSELLTLKSWQAVGITRMLQQEMGEIPSGILNDDYGLGKTVQALGLINEAAKRQSSQLTPTITLPSIKIRLMTFWISAWRSPVTG
ncbi:hypothetical protein FQN49_004704 [Arthroderma sp. PD_2]|nr:hypothetical protein FQN49_004704 [Arthroderma sp. PD_2]